jgi:excisionase family DNA binding protein
MSSYKTERTVIPTSDDQDREAQTTVTLAKVDRRMNETEDGHASGVRRAVVAPFKLLVTPEEAAVILSVGRTRIFELIANGQLPSVRIGASRRIPMGGLEQLVEQLLDETASLQ